jgi:hypothetical protein
MADKKFIHIPVWSGAGVGASETLWQHFTHFRFEEKWNPDNPLTLLLLRERNAFLLSTSAAQKINTFILETCVGAFFLQFSLSPHILQIPEGGLLPLRGNFKLSEIFGAIKLRYARKHRKDNV